MSPLVSILIPCYNAEQWVAQAIQSALDQTYRHKEVIVIDDGSTDGSADIIRSFGDRIRFELAPHKGGNPARNQLLELARGEWLQYLDADDYLLPDKIERYMAVINERDDADLLLGPCIVEDWNGRKPRRRLRLIAPDDPWILVTLSRVTSTSCTLWRRQAIIDVGRWKEDQPCCQEFELYTRLLIGGKRFVFTSFAGTVKRQWSGNAGRDRREALSRIMALQARIEQYLLSQRQLTPKRQQAINEARFSVARETWRYDRSHAINILRAIEQSHPDFVPRELPRAYALLYHLLGFHGAQRIVDCRRMVLGRLRRSVKRA